MIRIVILLHIFKDTIKVLGLVQLNLLLAVQAYSVTSDKVDRKIVTKDLVARGIAKSGEQVAITIQRLVKAGYLKIIGTSDLVYLPSAKNDSAIATALNACKRALKINN